MNYFHHIKSLIIYGGKDNFKKAKYSFLYVGNKHRILYTKLLKQMNFDLLYTSKTYDKKKRCICIDDAAFNDLNLYKKI